MYFVFDRNGTIIEIEATNALEAIIKSGIENPIKVKSVTSMTHSLGIVCDRILQENTIY